MNTHIIFQPRSIQFLSKGLLTIRKCRWSHELRRLHDGTHYLSFGGSSPTPGCWKLRRCYFDDEMSMLGEVVLNSQWPSLLRLPIHLERINVSSYLIKRKTSSEWFWRIKEGKENLLKYFFSFLLSFTNYWPKINMKFLQINNFLQ